MTDPNLAATSLAAAVDTPLVRALDKMAGILEHNNLHGTADYDRFIQARDNVVRLISAAAEVTHETAICSPCRESLHFSLQLVRSDSPLTDEDFLGIDLS